MAIEALEFELNKPGIPTINGSHNSKMTHPGRFKSCNLRIDNDRKEIRKASMITPARMSLMLVPSNPNTPTTMVSMTTIYISIRRIKNVNRPMRPEKEKYFANILFPFEYVFFKPTITEGNEQNWSAITQFISETV